MMEIGKGKTEKLKQTGRIDFVYGNAQEMPFADDSFDAVTCA